MVARGKRTKVEIDVLVGPAAIEEATARRLDAGWKFLWSVPHGRCTQVAWQMPAALEEPQPQVKPK